MWRVDVNHWEASISRWSRYDDLCVNMLITYILLLQCDAGMDMNLAVQGLTSLGQFISMAAKANTNAQITKTLTFKHIQGLCVSMNFCKTGINQYLFTWWRFFLKYEMHLVLILCSCVSRVKLIMSVSRKFCNFIKLAYKWIFIFIINIIILDCRHISGVHSYLNWLDLWKC